MLKRFKPAQPDGTIKEFDLPDQYVGGPINIFMNGQMLNTRDDDTHPYGYTLDEDNKSFEFYIAPLDDDFIYLIYDSDGSGEEASDYSGTGLMRLKKGYNLISYQGLHKAHWDKENSNVVYSDEVLANVMNLIIDQIEDIYSTSAVNIIREIQTYSDDSQKYYTFKPGSTGVSWCGDAEHVYNKDLYRSADDYEYGDPEDDDNVAYTPGNFILSNCKLDGDLTVISLDEDNSIEDLPAGLRTGIHIYVKDDADLSATNDLLELWF